MAEHTQMRETHHCIRFAIGLGSERLTKTQGTWWLPGSYDSVQLSSAFGLTRAFDDVQEAAVLNGRKCGRDLRFLFTRALT